MLQGEDDSDIFLEESPYYTRLFIEAVHPSLMISITNNWQAWDPEPMLRFFGDLGRAASFSCPSEHTGQCRHAKVISCCRFLGPASRDHPNPLVGAFIGRIVLIQQAGTVDPLYCAKIVGCEG